MLIILPPSETKARGGTGAPLNLEACSFPELNAIRSQILTDLQALDPTEALGVLGISENLKDQAEANKEVLTSPTAPALERFTGVLYDALDAPTLPKTAWERLAVGDALFGVIRADDMIPFYRLSGGTKLPLSTGETPTLKARWGKEITKALENYGELIIDLRSGTYQQLGKVKDAVTVRVEAIQPDGSRKVVSHFNKHYKGLLARELAQAEKDATSIEEVAELARAAGFTIEMPTAVKGPKRMELTMVVEP